ncbi:hypothetical protein CONLIGDRAFT_278948 [Coniochaeta ligniaria NRRL 30616]|uniref:Uncharacterized protein n=1 Tax=Coniochaeta ligniaria NRRL 30616 TaxID=1408157 RepID=A0A1J7I448_9PEZI|nr:hypothetical protein CONLIGDRAFT_278948 [Coniochaeta ligniaria NRRL 30616]
MAQRNRRNRLRFDPDPSDDDDQDDDDQDDDDQDDDEVDYSALELSVLLRRRGRRPSTQGLELCFHRPWASTAGTLRLHFGADPDQPASIEFDDPTGPPGHVPESYLRAHPPDAPGFIVRYDAVRLFPVDDDDDDDEGRDVLRLGHGHNHNHNHDASSPQPQPLEFIRRLAIVVGGLYILLCIVFSAKARLMRPTPLLSTTECVVDTTELPLFSQTDNIFLSYASVPRVVIFGESGATCGPDDDTATTPDSTGTTRTQCRPRDGPVYPQHDDAVDVAALPLPTTAYRLCETSSDGRFVPETVFLEDLANIVLQVGNDLRRLADAGPMDFRFTRLATVAPGTTVSSTQFRWSTEPGGGGFIGSHAALPAVARPRGSNDKTARGYANPWMPASTAPDGSTQPTARPPSPLGIRSQDPPLDELCDAVVRQVRALGRQHVQATQSLLATVATQAQVAYLSHVDALDDLVDYALDDDPADNRTNSDRARLLHNRREELRTGDGATVRDVTTTVHPLDSPETPPASAVSSWSCLNPNSVIC